MISEVEVRPIIHQVVEHHSREKFGDFRDIFMSLLEDNTSDRIMLTNVCKLLEVDAFNEFKRLFRIRTTPVKRVAIQKIEAQAQQQPSAQPPPAGGKDSELVKSTSSSATLPKADEIPQVSLLYVLSRLQSSVRAASDNDEKIAIGTELANTLIPAMQLFKPVHIHKSVLYDSSGIQLQKRIEDTTFPPNIGPMNYLDFSDTMLLEVPLTDDNNPIPESVPVKNQKDIPPPITKRERKFT
jgi:hypothetical protein